MKERGLCQTDSIQLNHCKKITEELQNHDGNSEMQKHKCYRYNIPGEITIKPSSKKANYDELENEVEFLLDLINKKNSKEEKSEI